MPQIDARRLPSGRLATRAAHGFMFSVQAKTTPVYITAVCVRAKGAAPKGRRAGVALFACPGGFAHSVDSADLAAEFRPGATKAREWEKVYEGLLELPTDTAACARAAEAVAAKSEGRQTAAGARAALRGRTRLPLAPPVLVAPGTVMGLYVHSEGSASGIGFNHAEGPVVTAVDDLLFILNGVFLQHSGVSVRVHAYVLPRAAGVCARCSRFVSARDPALCCLISADCMALRVACANNMRVVLTRRVVSVAQVFEGYDRRDKGTFAGDIEYEAAGEDTYVPPGAVSTVSDL